MSVVEWRHQVIAFVGRQSSFHVAWSHFPEGKSRGLCLVQVCAKYRLVDTRSSSYH